ncbi:phage baseplate assembly protein V [Prevotella melaninogenica]|uniref:phage baseplate assembly protein V n=1 Tax=Prevotella melaninogenica TaxID=28132 RepID=UPI002010F160|nr:phage baseplate assembly protein V [Prevotella melaninogenica]
MNWQTDGMQTGWVRVMTPDGGSSSDVKSNRGFIPEVGDQVLLGFRHGDPAVLMLWVACLMERLVVAVVKATTARALPVAPAVP